METDRPHDNARNVADLMDLLGIKRGTDRVFRWRRPRPRGLPADRRRTVAPAPGARHLKLPWAGHLPGMERPDELNPVLLDFPNETLATR
jgi:hypothetical protein